MTDHGTPARAMLDAWREQGADRLDPMRFHFMDALDRRAARHDGEARRLLDARLSLLLEAYSGDLERATSRANHADHATTPDASAHETLGGLIEHMASYASTRTDDSAMVDASTQTSLFPTLDALDEFRKLWSRVRTESQLRQSLEQAPTNAGPLNSSALVHRSIALMRELSPGYLQQFLSYVDDLSSIEQLNARGALAASDTPLAPAAGKRTRGKARSRRE